MIADYKTRLGNNLALPLDGTPVVTTGIDTRAAGGAFDGSPLYVDIVVTTALAATTTDSIQTMELISDSVSTLNSSVTDHGYIGEFLVLAATDTAVGTHYRFALPPLPAMTPANERYIGIRFDNVGTDYVDSGNVEVNLVMN